MSHEAGYFLATLSWLATLLVFARRFADDQNRRWTALCIAIPVAILVLMMWPDLSSFTVRTITASSIQFAFLAVLSRRLIREL